MIEIKKTDGRHTGTEYFKYVMTVKRSVRSLPIMTFTPGKYVRSFLLQEFDELRHWCVDTWGMSCDRTHYLDLKKSDYQGLNIHWCWHTEYKDLKIYLASEKEANWMKLRWGG